MSYYIDYYKEKDTDPMVFLQRFRCTTEPIGGGTEQDEEGELVSWDAAVAAIEIAMKRLGWHPASKLPPVDENGNSPELIAITSDGMLMRVYFHQESKEYSFWVESDDWNKQVKYGVNVKWWSYPPKED